MKALMFTIILSLFGLYPETGKVVEVCPEKDIVLVTTSTGNTYEFYPEKDGEFELDSYCSLIMHNNKTATVKDDMVVDAEPFRIESVG